MRIKKTDISTPWAKRSIQLKRDDRSLKKIQKYFRIYCEGINTEPNYFKSFPINAETTQVFTEGYGRQKEALVKHVISLLKKDGFLKGQKNYDKEREIWIVFDYDVKNEKHECNDYKNAIKLCINENIKLAYSNDAFELWFLLHFQYIDTAMHREIINEKLDGHLDFKYSSLGKTEEKSKKMYSLLLSMQTKAIKNAEKLFKTNDTLDLCDQNPITSVYKLVEQMNKYIRK